MVEEDVKKHIAVIGNEEFTLGFRLIGVQEIYNKENYEKDMKKLLARDDIGIVVAEESDVEELPKRVQNDVRDSVDPVVVKLSEEAEDQNLKEQIRQVIGADIA